MHKEDRSRGLGFPTKQVPRSHSEMHLAPSGPAGVALREMRVPSGWGGSTSILPFSAHGRLTFLASYLKKKKPT